MRQPVATRSFGSERTQLEIRSNNRLGQEGDQAKGMTRSKVETVSPLDGSTEKEKNQTGSVGVLWFREETGSKRSQGRLSRLSPPLGAEASGGRSIYRRIRRARKHLAKGDLMPKSTRALRRKTPASLRL